eukprot:647386-Alexandrium_andersonii.AAC.1
MLRLMRREQLSPAEVREALRATTQLRGPQPRAMEQHVRSNRLRSLEGEGKPQAVLAPFQDVGSSDDAL